MTAFTYSSAISGGQGTSVVLGFSNWAARRIAPPRDSTWLLERIRLGAFGGMYLYQTNFNGFGQLVTTNGSMPCAGLWRNRIAPETEIVFDGCVPPKMKSYEPQIPVIIRPEDFLIFAVHDAYLSGGNLTVSLEIDVDETVKRL